MRQWQKKRYKEDSHDKKYKNESLKKSKKIEYKTEKEK